MRSTTLLIRNDQPFEVAGPHALDSEQTLVILFGAPEMGARADLFEKLRAHFPTSVVVGCSTAGEIHNDSVHDGCLSVAAIRFEGTTLRCATAPVRDAAESRAAGAGLARMVSDPALRSVFVLSDGLSVNGTQLLAGINDVVPSNVVVTGGLAGDGDRFGATWVVADGKVQQHVVVAVGLYGERLRVGHGSRGGWDAFGPPRVVTRAVGNVVSELGGRPALEVYREYLGDLAAGLPATALLFPLSLRSDHDDQQVLVRTVLSIDDATQSMTFAGDIPAGSRVQLMRANVESLVEGAADAARSVSGIAPGAQDTVSIAISCVGRRLVLGERAEEEVEAARECLAPGTNLIGFYSYGEISPGRSGFAALHNQTMTITTFGEA